MTNRPSGDSPRFEGGPNLALKTPAHLHEPMVAFYRDILKLPVIAESPSPVFAFGTQKLWIDRVAGLSQRELWLEVRTADQREAADYLEACGVMRCDEVEALPEGFSGFWVAAPGGIVHLVCGADD
ncbi:MAG: hypothetical protein GVY13_12095 [Alphaproteobacteria bacterium]|jgi:hypothetical protein|nr:hypothetical protein [Alphaproteobacteria bacterium]